MRHRLKFGISLARALTIAPPSAFIAPLFNDAINRINLGLKMAFGSDDGLKPNFGVD
jgi:hypothetical protein